MIEVYTDVSVRNGNAVATCFILTSTHFIGSRTFEYKNVCSTLQGELLGLLDAIRFLKKVTVVKEPIRMFCDSEDALKQVNGCSKSPTFKSLVASIHSECENVDVEFKYVKGHQRNHNPNKVVDLVSKSVLRYKHPPHSR